MEVLRYVFLCVALSVHIACVVALDDYFRKAPHRRNSEVLRVVIVAMFMSMVCYVASILV